MAGVLFILFFPVNLFPDFFVGREIAGLMFGIDQSAIQFHIKNAAFPFDQLRLHGVLFFQKFRQPGGTGIVISDNAVFNGYFHAVSPFSFFNLQKI